MTSSMTPRLSRNIEVFLGRELDPIDAEVGIDGFTAEAAAPLEPGAALEGAIGVGGQLFPFAGEVRWTARFEPREARRRFAVRITWVSDEYFRALRANLARREEEVGNGAPGGAGFTR